MDSREKHKDLARESQKSVFMSLMKNVTIFAGFSAKELNTIFGECPITEKKKGEIIIEEGTSASEIYIILQGKVSIILDRTGDPVKLAVFGPGDCLGEASVIGVQKHSVSAIATECTELLVLTRAMLMEIYDRDKNTFSMLILNIARELARRLHRTDQVLLHYGKKR
ncbi:MAG: cyclic nucleotide-binding domain-containing protein [Chitinispirillaceae bacterium]|jgi:CRP-like cAMP-binding protein|nr:cyclic nucleotide-binding domain-containing protein [Chitinispirillaceae bacterium]